MIFFYYFNTILKMKNIISNVSMLIDVCELHFLLFAQKSIIHSETQETKTQYEETTYVFKHNLLLPTLCYKLFNNCEM